MWSVLFKAALQEILTSMTQDVMDAGMLDNAMEPADYQVSNFPITINK